MSDIRIGIGHDTHRLDHGGPLIVGGIEVPHEKHAVGHSDADVLFHAITDALLGALGLGDIGEWFPDDDQANKDRDSAEMLLLAFQEVKRRDYQVSNLDCIIFAQRPKLSPHKEAIRKRIAELLEIKPEQVNVKAKTGEKIGPIGREEGISSECVLLIERQASKN